MIDEAKELARFIVCMSENRDIYDEKNNKFSIWLAAKRDAAEQKDKQLDQVISERDQYHEAADKLAHAIAEHLDIDIGEHSSAKNPWHNALEALDRMGGKS